MRQPFAAPPTLRPYGGVPPRPCSPIRIAVLTALYLLSAAQPGAAQVGLDTLEVRSLEFRGNHSFRASAIRDAILTEDTHCRAVVLAPFCWLDGEWAIERRTLSRPELGRDIPRLRLFYFRRGFRESVIDTTVVEDGNGGVAVTFQIQEGRPVLVSRVAVEGGEASVPTGERRDLPLQPGQPLSLLQLEASREALLTRFRNEGFAHVDVLAGFTIPASTPYAADVSFEVIPGPRSRVGAISVEGVRDLDERTVRRVMGIEEGELYSEERLAGAQRNVFQLDIVRHAEIVSDLTPQEDSVVPLEVRVNEAAPHRIRGGAGLNTFECFNLEARWTSRNFRGGGRRLQVSTRLWNALADELAGSICNQSGTGLYGKLNYQVSADFLQPVVFSPRNSFSTRVFFERESFPNLFVRQTVGTDLLVSRNIGRLSATGIFYRPQYGSYDAADAYFCSSFLICEPEQIAIVSSANLLSPVGITLSTDRTNPVTDPVRGWTGMITFEKAGTVTLSDYSYDRLILEGSAFTELGSRTQRVLGARLRVGQLQPRGFGGVTTDPTDVDVTAPQKRFFTGGASSVRGFAQGRLGPRNLQTDVRNLVASPDSPEPGICRAEEILDLTCDANALAAASWTEAPSGGNVLLVGNLEYRSWLTEKLQATVFLDFGQVWTDPGAVGLGDIELTPGFGIRYPTPIGPIRVDLAYNFRRIENLPAITSQLDPFDPEMHDEQDIVTEGEDGTPYVVSAELAPLIAPVAFGSDDLWSFRRLQLHLSIGQAF